MQTNHNETTTPKRQRDRTESDAPSKYDEFLYLKNDGFV